MLGEKNYLARPEQRGTPCSSEAHLPRRESCPTRPPTPLDPNDSKAPTAAAMAVE